jgi:exo-beta-1,3-glucanase (GH17 family)/cellulose synthase/poly-beta-1,6-N-acetylglucosamine synthase-like glycosyltransferase
MSARVRLAVALLIGALNALLWAALHRPLAAPDVTLPIGGLAVAPYRANDNPLVGDPANAAQIERDLKLLSRYTSRLRTYGAGAGLEVIAQRASAHGLNIAVGAWLDRRAAHNDAEIARLLTLAKLPAVDRLVVGNETLLRGDLKIEALIAKLDQVRAATDRPVSTADSFATWMAYPELAAHVDYVMVHLLPYWEGVPIERALAQVSAQMDALKERYPQLPIVIGEAGWPSRGERFEQAVASRANAAQFLRGMVALAAERGWDYYLIEAFDQPWKRSSEGRVGAYWGVFDVKRAPKFSWTGPIDADPSWWLKALLSSVFGVLLVLALGRALAQFEWRALLFFALLLQASASLLVWLVALPFGVYLRWYDLLALGVLAPAQLMIIGILLVIGYEFAEVVLNAHRLRRESLNAPQDAPLPCVALHLPISNEPPEMVIATLDSLAALNYPDFSVIVIDNNTRDAALWQPVAARCAELGARFQFASVGDCGGFKAGALNVALAKTASEVEIVGLIDADYVVSPDWLQLTVNAFADHSVGFVQLPQAHREFDEHPFRRTINSEYDGFFRLGMHHRQQRNALILHGTMVLIRASALRAAGGWAEWCICEDAELGVRLLQRGWRGVYIDVPLGHGLTPADLGAYQSQRLRWAFGAMQILRAHGRSLLQGSGFTRGQRFHFLTGWVGWIADALHAAFSLLAIAWTLGILFAPGWFPLPLPQYLLPVLALTIGRALLGIVSYRACVDCAWRDTFGAALASMALTHTVARGVVQSWLRERPQFLRTAKKRRLRQQPRPLHWVREELAMLLGLATAASALVIKVGVVGQPEAALWLAVLLAQAVPYAAALGLALIGSRNVHDGPKIIGQNALTDSPSAPANR